MNHSTNSKARNTSKDKVEVPSISSKKNNELQDLSEEDKVNDAFPDYPIYPPDEDIYSNYTKEDEVDIEHPYSTKSIIDKNRPLTLTEKEGGSMGDDLDIPGAELDDELEFIGSEDEENNYYSLGGDNHEDLDESREDDM